MNYEEMKSKVFAKGSIPNGYFGDRTSVGFAFHEGLTIVVNETPGDARGCFGYQTPLAVDVDEAWWLLNHHPSSNASCLKLTKQSA